MTENENENKELFFDVQQKTDKQHILDNPDTYIGSVETIDSNMWIIQNNTTTEEKIDTTKIIEKNITFIPGLYKLFDEGIVNCRDHFVRMKSKITSNIENALPVTHIDISIDNEGIITMINDGNGIDIIQKDGIWIPELVFGHLRTSTNYNKEEKKIVGGKNGFGFKLVLIWSVYGYVETIDHIRGLKYTQEYENNLDIICKPKISKCKTKPYTKVVFKPDYKRFGIEELSSDFISLLERRVYDICAITDKNIKVKYNNKLIPIKNFQQYIDFYIGDKNKSPRVYEENCERWEYAVALTPNSEFVQISFVNGIYTSKGGKHVEYILNQIIRKLTEYIEKKKKIKINMNTIKEQLILFLRCDIDNPSFDSQTKDYMNTPSNKFGSKCDVSDKFIEKIAKMGVMESACALTEVKEIKAAKKTDGNKTKIIRGIPKLTDANWAGTTKSKDCILILCEGDSAKSGILSGLSSEDRNIIGVYPLKGKLLNVRGEPVSKITNNKEITEIKQILGLTTGKIYKSIEEVNHCLRYSKVLFMTDQDLDGSHIKGLGINLFSCEWTSLIEIPQFIGFMNTPILKAKKGNQELNFYNDGEFNEWKTTNDVKNWKIKYYKGLGTSTGKEFREYFENKKIVNFQCNDENTKDIIDMVFNKKRADDRKDWLQLYDRSAFIDTRKSSISYDEFINKEFIHFSKYDCDRSIPNIMDGLKISQRKILYSAFKRNLISEIKVAQFSGYVSEHSGYHHGEASLNSAIIGMAQNFVGSNNINLLMPEGQFGTRRLSSGQDHASERYIFTYLNPITRLIFPDTDDNVLEYLSDDGLQVEPIYYGPIIPMILVNGSMGIGTGFSTDIMSYNPLTIIEYIKLKLTNFIQDSEEIEFIPYYEGFKGIINKANETKDNNKFIFKGIYQKIGQDKIRVTELPVGFWTQDFKELLENLINLDEDKTTTTTTKKEKNVKGKPPNKKNQNANIIKEYEDMSNDKIIDFTITFAKGKVEELEGIECDYNCNGLEKLLKLYKTNTITNMHLFDSDDKLQKYDCIKDIIDDYYIVRLNLYKKRKNYLIEKLQKELLIINNKTRYIQENLDGSIDLRNKPKIEIIQLLKDKEYNLLEEEENGFKYLIKMPMDSVSKENVEKLFNEKEKLEKELEIIKNTTEKKMWLNELNILKDKIVLYQEDRNKIETKTTEKKKTLKAKITIK